MTSHHDDGFHEIQLNGKQLVFLFMAATVVSVVIFLFGVLVGRGFAYMRYKQSENYVAMAMEVAVEPSSGKITVRRVVCAHDCGLVVNPDALRNQIEGSILQTLSRTLHEEVKFDRSRVTSLDWASYTILRFPDIPDEIDIVLANRPDLPPMRVGEPASETVWPAIANAIYDAVGVRLRRLPFTSSRILAALNAG